MLKDYGFTELHEMYITQGLPLSAIALRTGSAISKISAKMKRLGIEVRPKGNIYGKEPVKYHLLTKEFLTEEYVTNQKTYEQIAIEVGCSDSHIWYLVKKFGITGRLRGATLKGRVYSLETLEKMAQGQMGKMLGENNPRWKGGVSTDATQIRKKAIYYTFRQRVLRFKGKVCAHCGVDLISPCPCCNVKPVRHVHHLQSFADFPELRFDSNNAIVLCEKCHRAEHKK
jgi:hypothetical protein